MDYMVCSTFAQELLTKTIQLLILFIYYIGLTVQVRDLDNLEPIDIFFYIIKFSVVCYTLGADIKC